MTPADTLVLGMRGSMWSNFAAAVVGGTVVATGFVVLGVAGRTTTRDIVQEAPAAALAAGGRGMELTPHAIYLRDAPGVVFVKALVTTQVSTPFDLYPQRQQTSSTGSGFLISAAGYVLTNYHVVEGADPATGVSVQFEDNITRPAVVVGADESDDLALLHVSMEGLSPAVRPLPLGDSSSVRVGDPTLALGNPFGLDRTLTSGIVSALQRQIQAPNGFAIANVIQTDAPINPGSSGGPLLDAYGRVIGINSQMLTAGAGGSVGIAFAVPIDTAKGFLPQLEHGGVPTLAYLGVSATKEPASARRAASATRAASAIGVPVDVQPGGPAARAGLRDDDRIEAIDGRRVGRIAQIRAIVTARMPGVAVSVTVRRGRQTRRLRIVLGAEPMAVPAKARLAGDLS